MSAKESKKSFLDSIKSKRRPLSASLSINNIHARYLDKRSSVLFDKENFDLRSLTSKAPTSKATTVNATAQKPSLKARKRLSMVSLRSPKTYSSDSDADSGIEVSPFTPETPLNDGASINLTSIDTNDFYDIPSSKRASNASEISEFVQALHSADLATAYIVACDPRSVAQESKVLHSFNGAHNYGAKLVESALLFSYNDASDPLGMDDVDYKSVLKNDPYTLE